MILKQKMKAIVNPCPTLFVDVAYFAVKAMMRDISIAMMMPVIHIVGLRPHLSTNMRQMMFAAGPTIPTCRE